MLEVTSFNLYCNRNLFRAKVDFKQGKGFNLYCNRNLFRVIFSQMRFNLYCNRKRIVSIFIVIEWLNAKPTASFNLYCNRNLFRVIFPRGATNPIEIYSC